MVPIKFYFVHPGRIRGCTERTGQNGEFLSQNTPAGKYFLLFPLNSDQHFYMSRFSLNGRLFSKINVEERQLNFLSFSMSMTGNFHKKIRKFCVLFS